MTAVVRMPFVRDDGGRKAAGFRGTTGDCVTRAIAIASGRPYREVYAAINDLAAREKTARGRMGLLAATGRGSSARTGVYKGTQRAMLARLGARWVPTMQIGQGCTVHLRRGELPETGRLVVAVSRHLVAVIDGVLHDTEDPSRGGSRCVYGYWVLPS